MDEDRVPATRVQPFRPEAIAEITHRHEPVREQHRRRRPALLAREEIERRLVIDIVLAGIRTGEKEPAAVGQLGRHVAGRNVVEFLDRTPSPLGGEGIPARAEIGRQRMPRLHHVDEAEADHVHHRRPRFVQAGKNCSRCHAANLGPIAEPAQAINSSLNDVALLACRE